MVVLQGFGRRGLRKACQGRARKPQPRQHGGDRVRTRAKAFTLDSTEAPTLTKRVLNYGQSPDGQHPCPAASEASALLVAALALVAFSGMAEGSVVGKIINAATGAVGAIKAIAAQIMLFALFLMIALLPLGIVFAVYIPMLPYIIWISVLISWMVAVAEAVIAAPLWMMMHINPEGEGISTGATDQGYKLVAAVFLRPALSIIAFFVASGVVVALGSFVLDTYQSMYDAVRSSNSTISLSGFFAWIGKWAVLAGLMMAIINKSFALTLVIPEAILRWIGASLTGGQDMTHETKGEATAIVGSIKGAGAQAVAPGMSNKLKGGGSPAPTSGDTPGGDKKTGTESNNPGADRQKPSNNDVVQ